MNPWAVETLNEVVDAKLASLSQYMRARFVRVTHLIEEFGPFQVGMPHIKNLNNKLWEIRVSGRSAIARGIYLIVKEKRLVVLHESPRISWRPVGLS
jgi:phage-related protein